MNPNVSVCLALYNGGRYIEEQLLSILEQLAPTDEVVVVDDASRDDGASVIDGIGDSRVRLFRHDTNVGYVRTFERALQLSRGDLILLSDQDDVWLPGRVEAMCEALAGAEVVAGNLTTLGRGDTLRGPFGQRDWRLDSRQSNQKLRNIVGVMSGNRPYYGCAMGLRRESLAQLTPFPPWLTESHDLWIALYGNLARSVTHLDQRVVARRLHEANQTPPRPRGIVAALRSRLLLLRMIDELHRRLGRQ